jgi:hypothetical protein
MKRIANWICLAVLLLAACSCARSPSPPPPPSEGPPYTYVIQADPVSLPNATFQVDVLKLNASTKSLYESVPIPEYFQLDSQVRQSAPVLKSLTLKAGAPETINLNDPEYKNIRYPGYSYIAVLAYPPGDYHPSDAKSDPRRKLLPLDPAKWQDKWPGKEREITITITRSGGIQCDPSWIDSGP